MNLARSGDVLPLSIGRKSTVDWEVQRLFIQLSPVRLFTMRHASVESLRRKWQLCVKAFASREPVGTVEERSFNEQDNTISLRIYTPARLVDEKARPALLWIHGGGFVFGDLYTAGATCRKLANTCGCVVIAVRYRLAPEFSLHTGLQDCVAAFRWLIAHAGELGLNAKKIAIGGDSAGGAFAALAAQRCREPGSPRPAAQVLVYPATDLGSTYPIDNQTPMPNRMLAELFGWLQTQIPSQDLNDPALSPNHAEDFAKLPPAIILTAGFDPLREEAFAYARKLAANNVPVQVFHFPGQFHGFLSFDAVLHGAQLAFNQIGDGVKRFFQHGSLETGVVSTLVSSPRSWGWLWLRPAQRVKEASVIALLLQDWIHKLMGSSRTQGGQPVSRTGVM
jgi:acetyl esterase